MKALIIGLYETGHEAIVKTAFEAGGGVTSEWRTGFLNQAAFDYASSNGFDAIIYSYSGITGYFSIANSNTDILLFMPIHGNTITLPQQLVVTECGNDLQASDIYEFKDNTQTADSYSNGYICGQLFYIAEQCSCSLLEARIRASQTSSGGIINTVAAISYSSSILAVGNIMVERKTGWEFQLPIN